MQRALQEITIHGFNFILIGADQYWENQYIRMHEHARTHAHTYILKAQDCHTRMHSRGYEIGSLCPGLGERIA